MKPEAEGYVYVHVSQKKKKKKKKIDFPMPPVATAGRAKQFWKRGTYLAFLNSLFNFLYLDFTEAPDFQQRLSRGSMNRLEYIRSSPFPLPRMLVFY
ncbi:hypothetical protein I7I50_02110 [Histoplasma capsulatum G186AR]|nr:hypothetical protein I7I50_02110 [Histoplasma capsulatum G186AR]